MRRENALRNTAVMVTAMLFLAASPIACSDSLPESTDYTCPCSEDFKCVAAKCRRRCTAEADCSKSEFCTADLYCAPKDEPFSFSYSSKEQVAKLDILWVIDNSASMCQEQLALAQNFAQFVSLVLEYLPNVDLRLAVTTTDAAVNRGKFVNDPAKTFPPACVESVQHPCLGDVDCQKAFGPGWNCKDYSPDQMYNFNGSINSSCTFRCEADSECCEEFCTGDCGADQSCIKTMCDSAPSDACAYECKTPGGGPSNSGCLRPPDTADCPASPPSVLTMTNINDFKCIAQVEPEQSYSANLEQGLKTAWQALDPDGPNAQQATSFVRPDAYLLIVFVTDEDDCSIDEEYCSPSHSCDDQNDEDKCVKDGGNCRLDVRYSLLSGVKKKLCCGVVKKDYFNICSLLGDWKGYEHHTLSYDYSQTDCTEDDDCEEGWYCKTSGSQSKCRPSIFYFKTFASYSSVTPAGTPIFSLTPAGTYAARFKSLKSDPAKVLVAAITGDGQVFPSDSDSLIAKKCLGEEGGQADQTTAAKLDKCVAYKAAKAADSNGCSEDPGKSGCEEFYTAKLECIRQCYIASKGNALNIQTARNTYICDSPSGRADFGSRYVQLAQMFGHNGLAANICADEGLAPALSNIAELLIKNAGRICLPRAPVEGEQVEVVKTQAETDGTAAQPVTLTQGPAPDGDYVIVSPWDGCCLPDEQGACTGSSMAIEFTQLQEPDAVYQISYVSE